MNQLQLLMNTKTRNGIVSKDIMLLHTTNRSIKEVLDLENTKNHNFQLIDDGFRIIKKTKILGYCPENFESFYTRTMSYIEGKNIHGTIRPWTGSGYWVPEIFLHDLKHSIIIKDTLKFSPKIAIITKYLCKKYPPKFGKAIIDFTSKELKIKCSICINDRSILTQRLIINNILLSFVRFYNATNNTLFTKFTLDSLPNEIKMIITGMLENEEYSKICELILSHFQ